MKLPDIEDRSRRSYLVVFGTPKEPNESEEVLREKVIKVVFEEKMGVECSSVARIHRLGKSPKSPVILYFQDYNEKQALFKTVKKLKGLQIYLQNGYCKDTLRKRKLLMAISKSDKDAEERCRSSTIRLVLTASFSFGTMLPTAARQLL